MGRAEVAVTQRHVSARAFCATGVGGGIDNSCGAKIFSSPDAGVPTGGGLSSQGFDVLLRQNKNGPVLLGSSHGNPIPGADKVATLEANDPRAVEAYASDAGVTSIGSLLKIGAATGDGAKVSLTADERNRYVDGDRRPMKALRIESDTPVRPDDPRSGTAKVSVTIETIEGGAPVAHYGYFQRSGETQAKIAKEKKENPDTEFSPTESLLGAAIFDKMIDSLEEVEKSGITTAYTEASGMPGSSVYQGYRIWGRFGFDAELDQDLVYDILSQSADGKKIISPEVESEVTRTGILTLQQLLATGDGEKWWKENGRAVNLTLDFTKKDSDGYRRYQKVLLRRAQAKSRGRRSYLDFISFVMRSNVCVDVDEWVGFRMAELEARVSELSAFASSRKVNR